MKRVTKNHKRSKTRARAKIRHEGVVVPMVTPVNAAGDLDEPAVDRLIDFLLTGGVSGIFVLGTTGEGVSVPRPARLRLVRRTVRRVKGRALVYAGLGNGTMGAMADGREL